MSNVLKEVENLIATKLPKELFGEDIDAGLKALQEKVHPDRFQSPAVKHIAEILFKRLGALAEEAKQPAVVIKSPKRTYTVGHLKVAGDVADIRHAAADGKDYLMKISRINGGDKILHQEMTALAAIHTAAGDTDYRKYFPLLVESFPAYDRMQRRINVFTDEPGWYTLQEVIAKHSNGLNGRHLAWIYKRLLTALGFAHRQKLVHGAIVPTHVMLKPANHGLQLVGWGQSVEVGQRITAVSKTYQDFWYPPEVKDKKPATPETDIYMAALLILWASGGTVAKKMFLTDIPKAMQSFIYSCLLGGQKMRPDDAWQVHDDFDALLREVYGPPRFVRLVMP